MQITARSVRLSAILVILAAGAAPVGAYTDIPLANPGFETGDGTGWVGSWGGVAHASYPIRNNTAEALGNYFNGCWGAAYQVVDGLSGVPAETFAADTTYHFTGLTGAYDNTGSANFEIGYISGAAFVPLASAIQPCTGQLWHHSHRPYGDNHYLPTASHTPDFGWNLRGGVYYTTAGGPEIGQPIAVQYTQSPGGAVWVDNFQLRKAGPMERMAYTSFEEPAPGSRDYVPGPLADELGFASSNVAVTRDAGRYFSVETEAANQSFQVGDYKGNVTFDWACISRYKEAMAKVSVALRLTTYEDAYHNNNPNISSDGFGFVLELDDGSGLTTETVLYSSFDGPDAQTIGSNNWHAGGDLDGHGEYAGIGFPMGDDLFLTFYGDIPEDTKHVRLKMTAQNAGSGELFFIDNLEFWGVNRNVPPGDANVDNMVDTQDFSILKGHFAEDPTCWCDANFNDDTVVDTQDFSILKAHFGEGGSQPAPEPATIAVLALGGLAVLLRRRR